MANQKPKKSGKKPAAKPEPNKSAKTTVKEEKVVKETKEVKATKETVATVVSGSEKPMKGFFAKKYDTNESIMTIFKTPKIWGALLGEMIGTMLLTIFLLCVGMNPTWIVFGVTCIYVVIAGLSGAHMNPLITVGMMATRRVSAIRGALYMLAQLLGAWVALIIMNAFRISSGTTLSLPIMDEVTSTTFWAVALIELVGAIIIAFCFARAIRLSRKQPLAFGFTIASAIVLATIFGAIVGQNFYSLGNSSFMFNPVVSLMYQILPTTADNFGELAQSAGLALAAYVLVPVVGGVIGFYVSDVATRLSCGGYLTKECCDEVCEKKERK